MNVLLGVGGSQRSYRALETAIDRAEEAGDELTVGVYADRDVGTTATAVEERVRETLSETAVPATVRSIEDDPGPRLVELADREGFDRIVLGSGQESPLGKIRLGPTAEFVLLNAQVPVTLVR